MTLGHKGTPNGSPATVVVVVVLRHQNYVVRIVVMYQCDTDGYALHGPLCT